MKETQKKNAVKKASEVVAKCENPKEIALSQYDIEKLIVTIRGEQVLIDQDVARIYGVTTKRLNEQAKRNIANLEISPHLTFCFYRTGNRPIVNCCA